MVEPKNIKIDDWDEPYKVLMESKQKYELAVKNYKARIILFFKQYGNVPGFNGVINTCEIDLDHFNNPCVVKLGHQMLPRQSICDFCREFDFYMPTIEFIEYEDGEWNKFILKAYYTFRKKKNNIKD